MVCKMHYAVSEVLKVISCIAPKQVKAKVTNQKSLLRNEKGCDEILSYLNDINISE